MKIKKGKSLCFYSAKGGVGKTTNLLNLAGIIEQLGKKVLLIDFDLATGGLATYLNKKNNKDIITLSDDLKYKRYNNIKEYTSIVDNYIELLCAPKDPRNANKISIPIIRDIINKAELEYDVVLIDMNHALDALNLTILENVDLIYFITTNDMLDLKNLRSLLEILDNIEINKYKILLNNSRDPYKDYYSMYDIKKILKHNIDYTLSTDLFLPDIGKYIDKGEIISLDRKFASVMDRDYQTLVVMATDLLGGDNNE